MGMFLPVIKPTVEYSAVMPQPAKEGETRYIRNPAHINTPLPSRSKRINVDKIIDLFHEQVKKIPNSPLYGVRKHIKGEEFGDFEWTTYKEAHELSQDVKYGIAKLNLCPDIYVEEHKKTFRFLGVEGINTEPWYLTDLATLDSAITIAAMVDTLVMEHIINETLLTSLQCDSTALPKLIELVSGNKIPSLKNVVVVPFYAETKEQIEKNVQALRDLGITVYYYEELMKIGKEYRKENEGKVKFNIPDSDTVNILIYTSGSTGIPKGALFDNRIQIANTVGFDFIVSKGGPIESSTLAFLPMTHGYGHYNFIQNIFEGAKFGIFSGSTKRIFEDSKKMNPYYLACVPRIFERMVAEIDSNANKLSPFWKRLYDIALDMKIKNLAKYNTSKHWLFDRLIFKKVNGIAGNKIKFIGSSSAPLQRNIVRKIRCLLSADLMQSLSSTECFFMMTCDYKDYREEITGGPISGTELKLVDVPELNYFVTDKNPTTGQVEPRGEVCVRGPSVIRGYFKDVKKNSEVFDKDGFFHTGDIAVIMNGPNYINAGFVIDRKKNIFKLSQGEFVVTEKVQNVLENSKFITKLCACGISSQNYLVGVATPNKDYIVEYFQNKGMKEVTVDNVEDYYENKELLDDIIKDFDVIGRKGGLKGFELVKKIYLSKIPFTYENGLATVSFKVKYNDIKKKFEKEINAMYGIK